MQAMRIQTITMDIPRKKTPKKRGRSQYGKRAPIKINEAKCEIVVAANPIIDIANRIFAILTAIL